MANIHVLDVVILKHRRFLCKKAAAMAGDGAGDAGVQLFDIEAFSYRFFFGRPFGGGKQWETYFKVVGFGPDIHSSSSLVRGFFFYDIFPDRRNMIIS